MIVNTEIVKDRGNDTLKISYIGPDGTCQMLSCPLTAEMQYNWKYAGRGDAGYAGIQSWNFKPVKKVDANGKLTVQRTHEIMADLRKMYPELMDPLFDLNIPDMTFMDIEVAVNKERGFPKPDEANEQINTVSLVNKDTATVLGLANLTPAEIEWIQKKIDEHCASFKTRYKFNYVYFDCEFKLVYSLINDYMTKAQCLTGWNFISYDMQYVLNRAPKIGVDTSVLSPTGTTFAYTPQGFTKDKTVHLPTHRFIFDYMEIYAKWDRAVDPKESNKLDWVSGTVLGTKKVEHQLGFQELWERKPAEYVFYNAVDSILVKEIDNKLKTSSAFFGLANLTHVPALTAFSPVKTLEIVQSEYLYRENRVMALGYKAENANNEGYEGAFVYDPIPGFYKNIFAVDFRSLYPSIEMQFNMSPDTYIKKVKDYTPGENEIYTVSGAVYRRDFKGFIPTITEDFFNQRRKYKKEMLVAEKDANELKEIYEKRFGKAV